MTTKPPILGIIGGMGPLATAEFFTRLVALFPAENDQDHPRILIDSNPAVPDRTLAILGKGPSPVPVIIETARNLENAGATFLAMPCITAHYIFDDIQAGIGTDLIHMIREIRSVYTSRYSGKTIGLLATDGTIKTEIFQSTFRDATILIPDSRTQKDHVMGAIYGQHGVKSGDLKTSAKTILKACEQLIRDGAEVILAGCTEIPVILKPGNIPVPLLDPVQNLAAVCAARLGHPVL